LIIDCLVYFRFIHSLLLARLAELIVQRGDTCLRVCVLTRVARISTAGREDF